VDLCHGNTQLERQILQVWRHGFTSLYIHLWRLIFTCLQSRLLTLQWNVNQAFVVVVELVVTSWKVIYGRGTDSCSLTFASRQLLLDNCSSDNCSLTNYSSDSCSWDICLLDTCSLTKCSLYNCSSESDAFVTLVNCELSSIFYWGLSTQQAHGSQRTVIKSIKYRTQFTWLHIDCHTSFSWRLPFKMDRHVTWQSSEKGKLRRFRVQQKGNQQEWPNCWFLCVWTKAKRPLFRVTPSPWKYSIEVKRAQPCPRRVSPECSEGCWFLKEKNTCLHLYELFSSQC
jgi:hypothetical protein